MLVQEPSVLFMGAADRYLEMGCTVRTAQLIQCIFMWLEDGCRGGLPQRHLGRILADLFKLLQTYSNMPKTKPSTRYRASWPS